MDVALVPLKTLPTALKIVAAAFVASMLFTWNLWARWDRLLPASPIIPLALPSSFFLLCASLLVLALGLIAHGRWQKTGLGVALLLWPLFVLLDINCFQPSFYFFASVFLLGWFHTLGYMPERETRWLMQCLMAVQYFFSGLHKINPVYQDRIYKWLINWYIHASGEGVVANGLQALGPWTPYLEMTIGIAMLVPFLQRGAFVGAITMHLFVLVAVGPWAHNFNWVIQPWNAALIGLNALFFLRPIQRNEIIQFLTRPVTRVALFFICLAPISYWVGGSDRYLAHDLYSGKASFGYVLIENAATHQLPETVQAHLTGYDAHRSYLNLGDWSFQEWGVPVYPEKRVFLGYKTYFERLLHDPAAVSLIIYSGQEYETIP